MKKVILIIALLITSSSAYSQNIAEEDVPSPVKDNLYANYKAANVSWEMEDGNYEAKYLVNGMEKSIHLNPAGEVIMVETQIDPAFLMPVITSYINENYTGAAISEAELIETNHVITYGVEISHNGSTIDLEFDEHGNFLQRDSGDLEDNE
jgi:hypothetical protein